MTVTIPATPARSRLKQYRTETMRPFVQKYQYQQLPLPEPRPALDEESDGLEIPTEPVEPDSGE
jgi:hypothetical protein